MSKAVNEQGPDYIEPGNLHKMITCGAMIGAIFATACSSANVPHTTAAGYGAIASLIIILFLWKTQTQNRAIDKIAIVLLCLFCWAAFWTYKARAGTAKLNTQLTIQTKTSDQAQILLLIAREPDLPYAPTLEINDFFESNATIVNLQTHVQANTMQQICHRYLTLQNSTQAYRHEPTIPIIVGNLAYASSIADVRNVQNRGLWHRQPTVDCAGVWTFHKNGDIWKIQKFEYGMTPEQAASLLSKVKGS